jgi:GNAT superfamily N-acetyltransferase
VLFLDQGESPVGYALFRPDGDAVYLRQLFVEASSRRRGVGSAALRWLREHAWSGASRVRVDVLIGNLAALSFWRSAGFADYCITLECDL